MNFPNSAPLQKTNVEESPIPPQFDIYRRNLMDWPMALLKYWWIILSIPAIVGFVAYLYVGLCVVKKWEATVQLLRTPVDELHATNTSDYYKPVTSKVLIGMIFSKENMTSVLEKLHINRSVNWLYGATRINSIDRTAPSNIYKITATTDSPQMSADIANTLAETFIQNYKLEIKRTIREQLATARKSCESSQKELNSLLEKRKVYLKRIGVMSITDYIASVSSQITSFESKILDVKSTSMGYQSQLEVLNKKLATLDSRVITYQEVENKDERALAELRMKLETAQQKYTEFNPIVIELRQNIKQLEDRLAKQGGSNSGKTIYGDNPEYRSAQFEISKMESQVRSSEVLLRTYQAALDSARADLAYAQHVESSFSNLSADIDNKRSILNMLEQKAYTLELVVQSDFSDIAIFELATPPGSHVGNHRSVITLAAFVLTLGAVMMVILFLETLKLPFRHKEDFADALKVPCWAVLPRFLPELRSRFYSVQQNVFVEMQAQIEAAPHSLFLVFDAAPGGWSKNIATACADYFVLRNKKVVRVVFLNSFTEDQTAHMLNGVFYGIDESLPEIDAKNQCYYFLVDDMTYLASCQEDQIARVRKLFAEFDAIIFEFTYDKYNIIFDHYLIENADFIIWVAQAQKTSKRTLKPFIDYATKNDIPSAGIICTDVEDA